MGLFDTISTVFIVGVLGLTPLAIIDGYFTQVKVLRKLEEIDRKKTSTLSMLAALANMRSMKSKDADDKEISDNDSDDE